MGQKWPPSRCAPFGCGVRSTGLRDRGFLLFPAPLKKGDVSEGSHTFEVRAVGAAGADYSAAFHHWTVDRTAPKVEAVSPADSKTGVSRRINLTAAFSERVYQPTING